MPKRLQRLRDDGGQSVAQTGMMPFDGKIADQPPHARHILTFARTLDGGGVERAQLRLAADWCAAGRRVTLMIGSADGPVAADLAPGIELLRLDDPAYRAQFALPRYVRTLRPDILFCPGNFYTSVAAWTRLRLGRACPPIVGKLSNSLSRADQSRPVAIGYRAWLRRHPLFLDRLVAMTPAMRAEAIAAMRFPPARVATIPNPPARHPGNVARPVLPDGRYILGLGRLVPQKRWERLIAALPRLAASDVSLLILGEGAERGALERRVRELNLQDRIRLPGHAIDPGEALARASVVALTSDYEGVPGALREALAHGSPVVATDSSSAVREIVTGPDRGSIVPVGDEDALVAALDHWLAPGRARPAPVPEPGTHAAADYLALFDELVAEREALRPV